MMIVSGHSPPMVSDWFENTFPVALTGSLANRPGIYKPAYNPAIYGVPAGTGLRGCCYSRYCEPSAFLTSNKYITMTFSFSPKVK